MNKRIVKNGLKLLGISIIFRVMAVIYFSYSWQWESVFIKTIDIIIGILFLSMWFIYGYRNNAGFKHGLIVGLIGISDAIILLILTLVLYITRGSSYYFGPIIMIPWALPFLGIANAFDFISDIFLYYVPFIAIFITAIGSFLGEKHVH